MRPARDTPEGIVYIRKKSPKLVVTDRYRFSAAFAVAFMNIFQLFRTPGNRALRTGFNRPLLLVVMSPF